MKRLITLIATLVMGSTLSSAAQLGEDLSIEIWNNSTAPHSNNLSGEQKEPRPFRVTNTTKAELLIFRADKSKATGQAVVICPGGGYGLLSVDIEGSLLAEWLADNGITAAVLKYRLPNGVREVPYEDALEAIKIMRERASELGYKADRVGIAGASAGGHLAASVSTLPQDIALRPDFSLLFYPVISSVKGVAHEGSFNNLLGRDRTAEESFAVSLEHHVDCDTPPAIMLLSADDAAVPPENSIRYYNELRMRGIYSAMYVFPSGGHGWSMSDRVSPALWQPLVLDWLAKVNELQSKKK